MASDHGIGTCTGRTRPLDDEHIEAEVKTEDGRLVWCRMALASLRFHVMRVTLPKDGGRDGE